MSVQSYRFPKLLLSLYYTASTSTSLPWTMLSNMNNCFAYKLLIHLPWCPQPYLLGDGKLLKAETLVISLFLFPEYLAQWISLHIEFKQHSLRRGLERLGASCLQTDCVCLHICSNTQLHPWGKSDRFSIIHDLPTFLHPLHLVHRNFGGFILVDGIYYKC